MTTTCGKCADGWVCETHPDSPFPHPDPEKPEERCAGPGMLCDCPIGRTLGGVLDATYRRPPSTTRH